MSPKGDRAVGLHTVLINGTELHYQEAGEGDTVILVHGSLADYRTWRRQFTEFSKRFHVISYSRRFHYPNRIDPDDEYSVQLHSADLVKLIEHFSTTPVHIVSASWGGNVALHVALTRPDLLRCIVLSEPPVLPLLSQDPHWKHLVEEFESTSFFPARAELLANRLEDGVALFVDGVMGHGAFRSMPASVKKYFLDNAAEFKAEATSTNYFFPFTLRDLSIIHTPALLIEGDRSPKFFHVILDILQFSLRNIERRIVSNAAHAAHVDNAFEYNAFVMDFLSRH